MDRMSSKPIVVGVDAAPVSLRAAGVAWNIAAAAKTKCYFVHAVPEVRQTLTDARRQIAGRLRHVAPPAAVRALDVRAGRAARVLAEAVARR